MQKKTFFGVFLAIVLLLSGCGSSESETSLPDTDTDAESDILSILFHQPYVDAAGIKVHYSRERKTIISKIEKALHNEPVILERKEGGWFSNDYYAVTMNSNGYRYYGNVKNNRPDGFGVLARGKVDLNQLDTLHLLVYAGSFSKGRFDGYGAKFLSEDLNYLDCVLQWSSLRIAGV